MVRRIIAVAHHRPSFRRSGWDAQGADEDAFTLAVAAAERLLGRTGVRRGRVDAIEVVGSFGPEANAGLPEAIGEGAVTVRRHGVGLPGLSSALAAASHRPDDGRSLVLAADLSAPAHGAGAIAFELGQGEGLEVQGHGGRRHPNHRAPDAAAWALDALRHSGTSPSDPKGLLYVAAESSPPVLLAVWRKANPGMTVVDGPWAPEPLGRAPSVSAAWWVADLAGRLSPGASGVLAHLDGEETHFLGVRSAGRVEGSSPWPPAESPPDLGDPGPAIPPGAVDAVSEGAYVPRGRYLEDLPSRWRFLADVCPQCSATTFPQRGQCRSCGREDGLAATPLPRGGRVLASTVVAPGAQPTEFDPLVASRGAYGVVLAELASGIRVTLQVTDAPAAPLALGTAVRTELRRLYATEGEWRYGRKAIPIAGPGNPG